MSTGKGAQPYPSLGTRPLKPQATPVQPAALLKQKRRCHHQPRSPSARSEADQQRRRGRVGQPRGAEEAAARWVAPTWPSRLGPGVQSNDRVQQRRHRHESAGAPHRNIPDVLRQVHGWTHRRAVTFFGRVKTLGNLQPARKAFHGSPRGLDSGLRLVNDTRRVWIHTDEMGTLTHVLPRQ